MRILKASDGTRFKVSDEDAGEVNRDKWNVGCQEENCYLYRSEREGRKVKRRYAHRELMRPQKGQKVIFKNGDTFDLRRKNLVVIGKARRGVWSDY